MDLTTAYRYNATMMEYYSCKREYMHGAAPLPAVIARDAPARLCAVAVEHAACDGAARSGLRLSQMVPLYFRDRRLASPCY